LRTDARKLLAAPFDEQRLLVEQVELRGVRPRGQISTTRFRRLRGGRAAATAGAGSCGDA
jgi:hypothetical protein